MSLHNACLNNSFNKKEHTPYDSELCSFLLFDMLSFFYAKKRMRGERSLPMREGKLAFAPGTVSTTAQWLPLRVRQ